MSKLKLFFLMALLCGVISPAQALLKVGAEAPNFIVDAALAGKPFSFQLVDALKRGPVVLYFYPKAFTGGCTVEAHLFSDAMDDFAAMHVTVIGVSSDKLDAVTRFSVEECSNKFAVAADPQGEVIDRYDARLLSWGRTASRTSYVITPDRKIYYVYKAMSPDDHVKNVMKAVKQWTEQNGR